MLLPLLAADFGTMYTTWSGTNSCATGDYRFLEDFARKGND